MLAEELASLGVRVSVVCPDLIRTAMLDKQLDYEEEAALTFSGGQPLSVEAIAGLVFNKVLASDKREWLLPLHRGWLAKVGNVFPGLTPALAGWLKRTGRARLLKERAAKG